MNEFTFVSMIYTKYDDERSVNAHRDDRNFLIQNSSCFFFDDTLTIFRRFYGIDLDKSNVWNVWRVEIECFWNFLNFVIFRFDRFSSWVSFVISKILFVCDNVCMFAHRWFDFMRVIEKRLRTNVREKWILILIDSIETINFLMSLSIFELKKSTVENDILHERVVFSFCKNYASLRDSNWVASCSLNSLCKIFESSKITFFRKWKIMISDFSTSRIVESFRLKDSLWLREKKVWNRFLSHFSKSFLLTIVRSSWVSLYVSFWKITFCLFRHDQLDIFQSFFIRSHVQKFVYRRSLYFRFRLISRHLWNRACFRQRFCFFCSVCCSVIDITIKISQRFVRIEIEISQRNFRDHIRRQFIDFIDEKTRFDISIIRHYGSKQSNTRS